MPAPQHVVFAGIRVPYQLRRARRRSIGFSVRAGALVVTAPDWLPMARIETALQHRADWIVRKLAESREQLDRAEAARMRWRCGAALLVHGRLCAVRVVDPHAPPVATSPSAADATALHGNAGDHADGTATAALLRVALPSDAAPEHIRDAVHALLLVEARRRFTERLDHFAPQLGVRWTRLTLSNAATRWGSASVDGSIRLHWRLIQVEPDLLDYVVVHELAHLRVMDHSPRFWAVVHGVLPQHKELRRRLKTLLLPPWG